MTDHTLSPLLDKARVNHRPKDARSHRAHADWQYIESPSLDGFSTGDWLLMDRQRAPYLREQQAKQALEMLVAQKDAPSFGYQINNYEHCLQAATLAHQAGEDEETVVVSLFHDLGFVACNDSHGEFSAALLRPIVSEKHFWMLERHMHFQALHCATHPAADPRVREKWRGHLYFEYTARWVADYDQNSICSDVESMPLAAFEPMVHRIFGRTPKAPPLPD